MKYRLEQGIVAEFELVVRTNKDGTETWIPKDLGNSDYQRYLRWLEDPTAEESGTLS